MADMILPASPSSEPTAIVSVSGLVYQRYANRPAPAASTKTPATRTTRSQAGNLIEFMLAPGDNGVSRSIRPLVSRGKAAIPTREGFPFGRP